MISEKSELAPFCRICFSDDQLSELIGPCSCRGTLEFVHVNCLEMYYSISLKDYCTTCLTKYEKEWVGLKPYHEWWHWPTGDTRFHFNFLDRFYIVPLLRAVYIIGIISILVFSTVPKFWNLFANPGDWNLDYIGISIHAHNLYEISKLFIHWFKSIQTYRFTNKTICKTVDKYCCIDDDYD